MIENWDHRTRLLIGEENFKKLRSLKIMVAGLGGVGGYATELLCRAGIGNFILIDNDVVQPSNRNRQIIATINTENRPKTEIFFERLKAINPDVNVVTISEFLDENNIAEILEKYKVDYLIDAIDTLKSKIALLSEAYSRKIPIVSSMGSGGKIDPTKVILADISESYNCKLAYLVRKYLHRKGIYSGIKVVFSSEKVKKDSIIPCDDNIKKSIIGTISYIPAIFGCYCAYAVIKDFINYE